MKYKLIIILLFSFVYTKSYSQVEVTFKGQIHNRNSDSLTIQEEIEWGKTVDLYVIIVDKDGKFHATIKVPHKGLYKVNDGTEEASAFFKDQGKLTMTLDAKKFDETLKFKGDGALESNYMAEKYLMIEGMGNLTYYGYYGSLEETEFLKLNDSIVRMHYALLDKYPKLDKELDFKERNFYKMDAILRVDGYPAFYPFVTGKKLKLSDSYPDAFSDFDVNNEQLLDILNFRSCAQDYIADLRLKKITGSKPYPTMHIFGRMHVANEEISNAKVKEELIYYITRYSMKRSKDVDSCYNLFRSLVKKKEYLADIKDQYDKLKLRAIGAPSPKFAFKDRENNVVHLDSLNGKVVYIDIWATWCAPCIKEIPFMGKLQDTLQGKEVVFVSICREDSKERWKAAIDKYDLKGIHLFAEEGENKFFEDYSSTSYPHYILVGKDGKIISPDASRPGDPKLMEMILENL